MLTLKRNNHFSTFTFTSSIPKYGLGKEAQERSEREYLLESSLRARNQVLDYAFNNQFNYFITLTLDDKKILSLTNEDIIKKLLKQFNNFRNRYDFNFRYILIPELGKLHSRLHFHGLIYTENTDLLHFLYYSIDNKTNVYRNEWFFNNFGANQFIKIRYDNGSVGRYISKYMSKDCVKDGYKLFNRFYFCSKGLKTSDILLQTHDLIITNNISKQLDDFENLKFQNAYCTKYEIVNSKLGDIYEIV